MTVRTTVDISEVLHDRLKRRAELLGTSIPCLILQALEETYPASKKKGKKVTGPMIRGTGKRGPRFPLDENPHDLVIY